MTKVFIDSSFIIELLKGNEKAIALNEKLIETYGILLVYNHIVFSEITYQLYFKRNIPWETLNDILATFLILEMDKKVLNISFGFIKNYNLKPNDALILATCKRHNINHLISLDEDFSIPCKNEGISLLNSPETFSNLF